MSNAHVALKINQGALALFIGAHLKSYYHETLTQELISKLTEQIVDSFDYFINKDIR